MQWPLIFFGQVEKGKVCMERRDKNIDDLCKEHLSAHYRP